MSWETIAKINYNLSNISYVQPLVSYERTYTYPEEFAHIIGYVAEPNKKELKKYQKIIECSKFKNRKKWN